MTYKASDALRASTWESVPSRAGPSLVAGLRCAREPDGQRGHAGAGGAKTVAKADGHGSVDVSSLIC